MTLTLFPALFCLSLTHTHTHIPDSPHPQVTTYAHILTLTECQLMAEGSNACASVFYACVFAFACVCLSVYVRNIHAYVNTRVTWGKIKALEDVQLHLVITEFCISCTIPDIGCASYRHVVDARINTASLYPATPGRIDQRSRHHLHNTVSPYKSVPNASLLIRNSR